MSFSPGGGGGGSLSTDADVSLNSPVMNDVLTYDSTLAKWKNQAPSASSAGAVEIIVAASNAKSRSKTIADYQCDGSADEVEINQAIAAASALPNGGIVKLTEGTFTVADTDADGHCIKLLSKVTLTGQGAGTLIMQANAVNGKVVSTTASGVDNVVIANLVVDGNSANNPGTGSHCVYGGGSTTRLTVRGVEARNAAARGLSLNGDDNLIEACEFHHNGNAGIGVETSAVRTRLQGNYCHDNTGDGIYTGSYEIICIGNRSCSNADTGINLGGLNAADYGRHICIGNECYLNANSGINTGGGKHIVIANNECWANGRRTTTPRSNAGIRVRDNTVQSGGSGVATTSDGIVVSGNLCWDDTTVYPLPAGAIGQSYGVEVYTQGNGVPTNVVVSDNDLRGNLQSNYAVNGGTADATVHVYRNMGWITENAGTTTIASGATGVTVAHGLSQAPLLQNISVTPTSSLGAATAFWISSVTTTTFQIQVAADPGASGASFAWRIASL
ncbi:MAG TPA: right-handed parallel beta-helix repeat-containing protein [Candidatus Saccharimonadales bacterium]|nr:right-handed parallel beta-helix repeat-containing protein [Candidatus Saccharimonadales bacterium]